MKISLKYVELYKINLGWNWYLFSPSSTSTIINKYLEQRSGDSFRRNEVALCAVVSRQIKVSRTYLHPKLQISQPQIQTTQFAICIMPSRGATSLVGHSTFRLWPSRKPRVSDGTPLMWPRWGTFFKLRNYIISTALSWIKKYFSLLSDIPGSESKFIAHP